MFNPKPWWYPAMDNSSWTFFFFAKRKHSLTLGTNSNSEHRSIRSGCLCQDVQKRWCYVETFHNTRNMIFSNCVVPGESYVVTCHVYSIVINESSVLQMKFRLYGYILDILKTQLSCTILQTVFSCKYYLSIILEY
jgi:hypothetical protein